MEVLGSDLLWGWVGGQSLQQPGQEAAATQTAGREGNRCSLRCPEVNFTGMATICTGVAEASFSGG